METQTDEAQKVLVAAAAANSLTTTLNISFVSADEIDVDFNTMPGNQPNTYGNFIAIWQNSNAIPWNTEPLKTFPIPSNTQSGSASFTGLNVTNNSYIVGFVGHFVAPAILRRWPRLMGRKLRLYNFRINMH